MDLLQIHPEILALTAISTFIFLVCAGWVMANDVVAKKSSVWFIWAYVVLIGVLTVAFPLLFLFLLEPLTLFWYNLHNQNQIFDWIDYVYATYLTAAFATVATCALFMQLYRSST